MELQTRPTGPEGRVASLASGRDPARVYIFTEPSPGLEEYFTHGQPDQVDGALCMSFALDSEPAVSQSLLLTRMCLEARGITGDAEMRRTLQGD